jgi:hypothetical protein
LTNLRTKIEHDALRFDPKEPAAAMDWKGR